MTRLNDYLSSWWDALVHPAEAGRLILDPAGMPGFTRALALGVALLYAAYGATMGAFKGALPALVSAAKLPLLYLFTLVICLPSLYVLNVMLGPRLSWRQSVRLLLFALSANAAALASYAPLSLFFTLTTSTEGYQFLTLMHVGVFALAGLASLAVIALLFRATAAALGRPMRPLFLILWSVLYMFVGTQMAWTLRPWIGTSGVAWAPLRPIEGSFIEAVWRLIEPHLR